MADSELDRQLGDIADLLTEQYRMSREEAKGRLEALIGSRERAARISEHNLVFTKSGELDEFDFAEWSLDRLKELGQEEPS